MAEEQEQQNERLREIVFQGLGEASMCWSETPKGIFDSDHAARIGDEIMAAVSTALPQTGRELRKETNRTYPPVEQVSKRLFLFKADIIAEIIRWGIRQNPFEGKLPRKTEIVVEKLNTLLPNSMMEVEDIRHFINSLIEQVSEIREWNLSEVEYRAGVKVDDETRDRFAFVSRYDSSPAEQDFIDIDALKQNIIRSLEGKE